MRTPENTYDIFTALKDEIDKNRIQRSEQTEADDALVFFIVRRYNDSIRAAAKILSEHS